MNAVALISGGKDSLFAAQCAQDLGFTIVCLAHLQPKDLKDETDSYMYQSVCSKLVVDHFAEATGLPLHTRQVTLGTTVTSMSYYNGRVDDEVQDLYLLLKAVKAAHPEVTHVVSGAVFSDYQRLRVEATCASLGLLSVAPLWKIPQKDLLELILGSEVDAMVVKVASDGLDENHVGVSLSSIRDHLLKNESAIHVAGEGGEYETLTLSSSLFKKRLIIDDFELVHHSPGPIAPVVIVVPKTAHLEDFTAPPRSKLYLEYIAKSAGPSLKPCETTTNSSLDSLPRLAALFTDVVKSPTFQGFENAGDAGEAYQTCLQQLSSWCQANGHLKRDLVMMEIQIDNMADFPLVNRRHVDFFEGSAPPCRACFSASLPEQVLVRVQATIRDPCESRLENLHVQSLGAWAVPAVGPYSQAMHSDAGLEAISGVVGLKSTDLNLPEGGAPAELGQALRTLGRVVKECKSDLSVVIALVVCTSFTPTSAERETMLTLVNEFYMAHEAPRPIVTFAHVKKLPKGCAIEVLPLLARHPVGTGDIYSDGTMTVRTSGNNRVAMLRCNTVDELNALMARVPFATSTMRILWDKTLIKEYELVKYPEASTCPVEGGDFALEVVVGPN
ncbi:MAG: hypothetical protein KVP17_001782 [Porospora cf. gigantea B]|uniref:uncharacterized protein n=1 Tax=Porospora cf. gigantea B TaxID=2853592 RepID=UPI0035718A86|nr:MAG: hypothetical protein KVP17_001782 [Porospora cf. gigantea B]